MRCYEAEGGIFSSPELKFLDDMKVDYTIVAGCWGVAPLKFDMPAKMLQKDSDGVSFYARHAGACNRTTTRQKIYVQNSDATWLGTIAAIPGVRVESFEFGESCISTLKKSCNHLSHYTAYVTAYQRLSVVEQLMVLDMSKIVRVCVDGIYIIPEIGVEIPHMNAFRVKNDEGDKTLENVGGETYLSPFKPNKFIPADFRKNNTATQLHVGSGGCGKTHQLINGGYVKALYCAPSYKLTRSKHAEYAALSVKTEVIANLLSPDVTKTDRIHRYYNCLIIYEVSMIPAETIKTIMAKYSNMKIMCAGDIGFQLKPVVGEAVSPDMFQHVQVHSTDYRCKCPKLAHIKAELRRLISEKTPLEVMNQWGRDNIPTLTVADLKNKYTVKDMILAGTNSMGSFYTDLEGVTSEAQHCYTVHSIQGETAKCNLFIDIKTCFQPEMLYTVVSRAQYASQVYLIDNTEKAKYEGKIYRIVSGHDVYIGSTTLKRLDSHHKSFKAFKKGTGRRLTTFPLLHDGRIELIEAYECETFKQLLDREAEHIRANVCVNKTFKEVKTN
jgi:hypothetical protein